MWPKFYKATTRLLDFYTTPQLMKASMSHAFFTNLSTGLPLLWCERLAPQEASIHPCSQGSLELLYNKDHVYEASRWIKSTLPFVKQLFRTKKRQLMMALDMTTPEANSLKTFLQLLQLNLSPLLKMVTITEALNCSDVPLTTT